jgi:hypothetical protein
MLMRSAVAMVVVWGVACGRGEPAAAPPPTAPPSAEPAEAISERAEPTEVPPRFDRAAAIAATGPPTRAELFLLLSENSDVPLTEGQHCADVVGVELARPARLGDWIAFNLSVLEEDPIAIPAECEDDGDTWRCRVEFSTGAGGESPWTWGVAFSVRKSDRRPVPDSLLCTGAG